MSQHLTISPSEAADRLAIRELVEAYAHCADRRDAKGQMSLFTPDTHFVVYMNAKDPKPSQELHSREALAPVFADLNKYAATMHFLGQTTILTLTKEKRFDPVLAVFTPEAGISKSAPGCLRIVRHTVDHDPPGPNL
jgi:hypothetical protein